MGVPAQEIIHTTWKRKTQVQENSASFPVLPLRPAGRIAQLWETGAPSCFSLREQVFIGKRKTRQPPLLEDRKGKGQIQKYL